MEVLSATSSGVKDVRAVVAQARDWTERGGGSTVLFIDEIHRFNKAQQDALLPHVEEGVVTLIGATTENPYFEVNSALLSRLRVFRLEPLSDDDLGGIVERALADERGLRRRRRAGGRGPRAPHLASAPVTPAPCLNILESAASMAGAEDAVDGGAGLAEPRRHRDRRPAAGARLRPRRRRPLRHRLAPSSRSVRGNDPDAALYWLATMVAAGRTPSSSPGASSSRPPRTWATPIHVRCRSPWQRPRRSTGSGCPRRSTRSPRRPSTSRQHRSRTGPARPTGRRWRTCAQHGSLPVPKHLQNAPHRRHAQPRHRRRLQEPARLRGRRRGAARATRCAGRTAVLRRTDRGWEARIRERMDSLLEQRGSGAKKRW